MACPLCGSTTIHACSGFKSPPMTEYERKQEHEKLRQALEPYFKGKPDLKAKQEPNP